MAEDIVQNNPIDRLLDSKETHISQQSSESKSEISEKSVRPFSTLYGDAVSDEDANSFMSNGTKPKLIVLVGFADYGKTSFVASAFRKLVLQGGTTIDGSNYLLVNTLTIVGFERRMYLRWNNEHNEVNTKRTTLTENSLLHIQLQGETCENYDYVISDRSGEVYTNYVSRKDAVQKDQLIEHADLVVFFVNSQLLNENCFIDLDDKYTQLLTRLKQSNKLNPKSKFIVCFTKDDDKGVGYDDSLATDIVEKIKKFCELDSIDEFHINAMNLLDKDDVVQRLCGEIWRPIKRKQEHPNLNWNKNMLNKE